MKMLHNKYNFFLQDGTSITNEVTNVRKKAKSQVQPYLIWVKGQLERSTKFFLQGDSFLIDLSERIDPMVAFDRLYKLHFVLNVEYAKSLSFFYNFIDCFVYQMENVVAKPSVKSLNISLLHFQKKWS